MNLFLKMFALMSTLIRIRNLILMSNLIFLVSCSTYKQKPKFMARPKETVIFKEITYRVGRQRMKGFLAMPGGPGSFPGVLVVHEWWGQTEYPRERARMLAKQGYAAFAVDMYGGGVTFKHPREAREFSGRVMNNLDEARKNFSQALETLRKQENVDPLNTGAIGYCFGGAIVLEMARQKMGLKIAVSYHGDLTPLVINKIPPMKTHLLIFNGEKDPMVPKETLDHVRRNLKKAEIRYKLINYKEAKHGFTNREATELGKKFNLPLAYNEKADKDSWEKTLETLKLILKRSP